MNKMNFYACVVTTSLLVGCGGGGSSNPTGNNPASITGVASGNVSSNSTQAAGTLSVIDADVGQATFIQPTSLTGSYGTWSVTVSGATAAWRYTLDSTRAPSVTSTESLAIKSQDGSATQTITVTISVGSGNSGGSSLVTSVSDPVYAGAYASEKVAVFDRLNTDRARCGFGKLAQNTKLDQAAQNHATYIALNKIANTHYETQGNPGFTGYDPSARFTNAGYQFSYGGESNGQIYWGSWYSGSLYSSATQLSATNILLNLYASVYHLAGLVDKTTEVGYGISNFEYSNDGTSFAKTLNIDTGVPTSNTKGQLRAVDSLSTFPCDGVAGLVPTFRGESPDPFPSVDRNVTPYGQPVYVTSGPGTTLVLSSGTVTKRGGAAVATTTLTRSNDPNNRLLANEVFLVPTSRLADNSTYDVFLTGTSTGMVSPSNPTGAFTRNFSFTTGTILSQ